MKSNSPSLFNRNCSVHLIKNILTREEPQAQDSNSLIQFQFYRYFIEMENGDEYEFVDFKGPETTYNLRIINQAKNDLRGVAKIYYYWGLRYIGIVIYDEIVNINYSTLVEKYDIIIFKKGIVMLIPKEINNYQSASLS